MPIFDPACFALRLEQSRWRRSLLCLLAAGLAILLAGYHFGTFDQSIHIPFLKATADASLFTNDPFLELRDEQPSFFWYFFLPFEQVGWLEPALFVTHLLATWFTYMALWDLSLAIFNDALAAMLSVMVFTFPHIGFVGFQIVEFSLLPRTFVLPFLLWVFVLYLRGRIPAAFFLLGALANLHLLSVNFVAWMLLVDSLLRLRQIGIRRLLVGLGLFFLAATPLIWKSWQAGQALDWSLRPEWFSIVAHGILGQVFYLTWITPYILLTTLSGIAALVLFAIARSKAPSPNHDRQILHFTAAALIAMAVQLVVSYWLPVTALIQQQILRISLFLLIFAYLYLAHYLAVEWRTSQRPRLELYTLTVAIAVLPLAFFTLLIWATLPLGPAHKWRVPLASGLTLLGFFSTMAFVISYRLWTPGIHLSTPATPWNEVQDWARANTPKDATFITPPYIWSPLEADWRVFSERGTVATLTELLEIALLPDYLPIWQTRFEALAPGAIDRFTGNFYENREMIRQAYNRLSTEDLIKIACRYNADYLVVETESVIPFPEVYSNDGYRVYSLAQAKICP